MHVILYHQLKRADLVLCVGALQYHDLVMILQEVKNGPINIEAMLPFQDLLNWLKIGTRKWSGRTLHKYVESLKDSE